MALLSVQPSSSTFTTLSIIQSPSSPLFLQHSRRTSWKISQSDNALGFKCHGRKGCYCLTPRSALATEAQNISASNYGRESPNVLLEVKGLAAVVAESRQQILQGIDLIIREGEVHAIMGKNGSGKSTFSKFYGFLSPKLATLNMDPKFLDRNVNEGFSGGEKKRNEILQLAVQFH